MSSGSMREQMPQVAAIIDAFRDAFGAEVVDAAIRRGIRGGQGFHATENGHEVGTPIIRGRADRDGCARQQDQPG